MTARTLEPFDPAVVAPWRLGGGRRGALLLHGFASTPPELRHLGEHLAAHGWLCSAPALPGHATTPEDLDRTTWRDWVAAAHDAFDELAATCDHVAVTGQSMGGTIALHLAAHDHRVAAVATLAAPVRLHGLLVRLLPVVKHAARWYQPGSDVDLWNRDAVEELYSYGRRPTRAIDELRKLCAVVRDELPQVRCPVLVVHGRRDRTIAPDNAEEIAARLVCSRAVARYFFPRSGHGLSVDVDRDAINALVLSWFDRFTESGDVEAPIEATA